MLDEIKIVAADIDMTLTYKGEELPQPTIEAFEILHRNGVRIGLATGREIIDLTKTQGRDWGLSFEFDFIVGMNGGMVYDQHKDEMWTTELLTTQEMKDILNYMMPLLKKYKIAVNAEGGGNHNAMFLNQDLIESSKRHGFIFEDKTGDVDGFCQRRAYKFLFRTDAEHEQKVRDLFLAKFADDYQIVGTFPGTVEVMRKGFNKGTGLAKYAGWYDIPMSQIITFGDNENDNSMLEEAGLGVCLKDGSEGTKKHADVLTDYTCEEGGVGRFLLDHYIEPKGLK